MSASYPDSDAHVEASRLLRPRLTEVLEVTEAADCALRLQIAYLEARDTTDQWSLAHQIIGTRLADDLRAAANLVLWGYVAQAMALGATVFELSYTAAFIGKNDSRARTWLDWQKLDDTPWRRRAMVQEVRAATYD